MRYKKIVLFFCIALPASVILRIIQLMFTIEMSTGFFKEEYKNLGIYFLIIIGAFTGATAIMSFTSHRRPDNPPKVNLPIAIASFLMAISIGYDLLTGLFSSSVKNWQILLLSLTGWCSVIYFICFSLQIFNIVNIPKLCAAIPPLFFIFKIICSFTSISSLALITDNIMLMAIYCVVLLFMLSFAKVYNNIESETNFRKLMASGLSAVILCFTQSISHIVVNIITYYSYQHTDNATNFSVLMTGIFIAVYTFNYFSYRNVDKYNPDSEQSNDGNQLYI